MTRFVVIFILDDREGVWKLYLDDEDYTWKLKVCDEMPQAGTAQGDDDLFYPVTDLLGEFPLKGLTIAAFQERDVGDAAEAWITFATGESLVFRYEYSNEQKSAALRRDG